MLQSKETIRRWSLVQKPHAQRWPNVDDVPHKMAMMPPVRLLAWRWPNVDDVPLKMAMMPIAEEMDVTLCQRPNVDNLPIKMTVSFVEEMEVTLCQRPNVDDTYSLDFDLCSGLWGGSCSDPRIFGGSRVDFDIHFAKLSSFSPLYSRILPTLRLV
jgi:hypothetical protein